MAYTPPSLATPVILCQPCSVVEEITTYELVLQSPYEEPSPYLLVLRSRPDVDPVTATFAVTESQDTSAFSGAARLPVPPVSATLAASEKRDTSTLQGAVGLPGIDGEFAITESHDTTALAGDAYAVAPRVGSFAITESRDTAVLESTFTQKWPLVMEATEQPDRVNMVGAFLPYTGPGFLNATERHDQTQFVGLSIYDVSGEFAITEQGDTAAFVGDTTREIEAEVLVDTIVFSDIIGGDSNSTSLFDIFTFTDAIGEGTPGLSETWTFADAVTSRLAISGVATESVVFRDFVEAIYFATTADVIVFTDQSSAEVSDSGELADVVLWDDSATASVVGTTAFVDTITFTDTAGSLLYAEAEDSAQWTDSVTAALSLYASSTDTVRFAETLTGGVAVYAVLSDTFEFTDAATSTLTLVGVLSDTILFGDTLSEAAQSVYVVNAETGAVSTYTLTPVVAGVAEFRGTLYLAGPDGLFALDADQDEDGEVVWTIQTGVENFGTDRLKRIRDVNLLARTEDDTTLQVVADRYGQKQEWNYRLPPLTRDSYRDGLVKVGQGVQSVYYALGVQGIGPAEVDQLRVVIEPLSRRR
jgi:hypothetical protein